MFCLCVCKEDKQQNFALSSPRKALNEGVQETTWEIVLLGAKVERIKCPPYPFFCVVKPPQHRNISQL